jgi:hypothetical protein
MQLDSRQALITEEKDITEQALYRYRLEKRSKEIYRVCTIVDAMLKARKLTSIACRPLAGPRNYLELDQEGFVAAQFPAVSSSYKRPIA